MLHINNGDISIEFTFLKMLHLNNRENSIELISFRDTILTIEILV